MRNTRNKRSEAKSKNEKYEQKNNVKKLTKNRYLSSYHILFCFFVYSIHRLVFGPPPNVLCVVVQCSQAPFV